MDNLFLSNNIKGENAQNGKKKKFNEYKDQTIESLHEIENFLNQTQRALKKELPEEALQALENVIKEIKNAI